MGSDGSRKTKKSPKECVGFAVEKKGLKKRCLEYEYRPRRVREECLVRSRETAVGKGGGRERRRERGEMVFGGLLPQLRRAAASLSGRRGR